MKPETFSASIQNDSDRLYLNSNRHVVVKNGGIVIIDGKEVTYQAEKTETINLKKKFTNVDNLLRVKGDFSYKIFLEDVVNITFDEYQLESWEYASENKTSGYEVGQKLYAQKGVTSSDPSNVTGSYAELTVKKVDDTGKILNLSITGDKAQVPDEPPVNIDMISDEEKADKEAETAVTSADDEEEEDPFAMSDEDTSPPISVKENYSRHAELTFGQKIKELIAK